MGKENASSEEAAVRTKSFDQNYALAISEPRYNPA